MRIRRALVTTVLTATALGVAAGTAAARPVSTPPAPPGTHHVASGYTRQNQAQLAGALRPLVSSLGSEAQTGLKVGSGFGYQAGCQAANAFGPPLAGVLNLPSGVSLTSTGCVAGEAFGALAGATAYTAPTLLAATAAALSALTAAH